MTGETKMWRGISKRSLAFLLMICLILQGMMPIEVSGATVERSGYVYREDTQMYYIAQNEAGEFQVVWRDSNALEQRVEAEKFQIYQMINGEYILDQTQKAVVTQDSYSNWKLMAETIETEEQTGRTGIAVALSGSRLLYLCHGSTGEKEWCCGRRKVTKNGECAGRGSADTIYEDQ